MSCGRNDSTRLTGAWHSCGGDGLTKGSAGGDFEHLLMGGSLRSVTSDELQLMMRAAMLRLQLSVLEREVLRRKSVDRMSAEEVDVSETKMMSEGKESVVEEEEDPLEPGLKAYMDGRKQRKQYVTPLEGETETAAYMRAFQKFKRKKQKAMQKAKQTESGSEKAVDVAEEKSVVEEEETPLEPGLKAYIDGRKQRKQYVTPHEGETETAAYMRAFQKFKLKKQKAKKTESGSRKAVSVAEEKSDVKMVPEGKSCVDDSVDAAMKIADQSEEKDAVVESGGAWSVVARKKPRKNKTVSTVSTAAAKGPSEAKLWQDFFRNKRIYAIIGGKRVYEEDATESGMRKIRSQKNRMFRAHLKRLAEKEAKKAEKKVTSSKVSEEKVGGEAKAEAHQLSGNIFDACNRLKARIASSKDKKKMRFTESVVLNGSGKTLSEEDIAAGLDSARKMREKHLKKIRKQSFVYQDGSPLVEVVPPGAVLTTKRGDDGKEAELYRILSDDGFSMWYHYSREGVCYAVVAVDPRMGNEGRMMLKESLELGMTPQEYFSHISPAKGGGDDRAKSVDEGPKSIDVEKLVEENEFPALPGTD